MYEKTLQFYNKNILIEIKKIEFYFLCYENAEF